MVTADYVAVDNQNKAIAVGIFSAVVPSQLPDILSLGIVMQLGPTTDHDVPGTVEVSGAVGAPRHHTFVVPATRAGQVGRSAQLTMALPVLIINEAPLAITVTLEDGTRYVREVPVRVGGRE